MQMTKQWGEHVERKMTELVMIRNKAVTNEEIMQVIVEKGKEEIKPT